MKCFMKSLVVVMLACTISAAQVPLESNHPYHYEANFTTLSLSSVSEEFTTVNHPDFPSHSLRIRRVAGDWCDPSVHKYTGYIDISDARHLFFYFFESRSNPEIDDVMLWTNGGPGASSSMGLFFELGPCTVVNASDTQLNPYSWNNKANVFFIDQPIGTGFSYADFGEKVSTTEEAAKDVAAFVSIFFDTFDQFKGRAFHLAGESYAGRYLPMFATEIYEQNKHIRSLGKTPINLQSIMLGNGYTSQYQMKTALPRCEKWLKESCFDTFDLISCDAARNFCYTEMIGLIDGLNPYDLSKKCDGEYVDTLCYPKAKEINEYLAKLSTKELLGISPTLANKTSVGVAWEIALNFHSGLDALRVHTEYYVEGLLDRGINVLLYVGAYDWLCNWVGIERMVKTLEWHGSEEFKKQEWRPWYLDEQEGREETSKLAGLVKNAGRLTFLRIDAAGHMAPHDKPIESLAMVNKWLEGKPF